MRSELVYQAVRNMPNRLQLVQAVAKGTRIIHRADPARQRLAETINQVLERIGTDVPSEDPQQEEREEA